jgi:hypothetical protein
MRAQIQAWRISQNPRGTEISNADYIKLAISQFRVRRDLHATSEVPRIGNAEIGHCHLSSGFVIKLYDYSTRRRLHGSPNHCEPERNPPV